MKGAKKAFLFLIVAMVIIASIAGGKLLLDTMDYKATIKNMTFSSIDITTVPDGTYEGDFDAGLVYAKVRVAVKDGVMSDITLLEHRNGKGASAESVVAAMLDNQSTNVDSVSGATSSSKVIRKAVENALLKE